MATANTTRKRRTIKERLRRRGSNRFLERKRAAQRIQAEALKQEMREIREARKYDKLRLGPPRPVGKPGFVYLIRWTQWHKIGRSENPVRRLSAISGGLPTPPELIHVIETDYDAEAEAEMHRRYASKRIPNREWFTLDAQDVEDIKQIHYL